jgi:uncharacterized repeat protein (TIGR03803 family)
MKTLDFGPYALSCCCAAAMLAACGRGSSTPLSPSPAGPSTALRVTSAERTHVRPAYKVLYSFKGGTEDGADPEAALINVNGTLYSTTSIGGGDRCTRREGCGTVFSITTSGTEAVLHSFKSKPGGTIPYAALLNVSGTLYGTTNYGGPSCAKPGCGTVFTITPPGKETLLYSFGSGSGDGTEPAAALIDVSGTLYGTTSGGGANCISTGGCGTVFTITPSGKETVIHSFGGSGDGVYPVAELINVKGTLYGTTFLGGASNEGTVFAITTSGKESVLYSFKGGTADGARPDAGLTNFHGTLYGTTNFGGATGCTAGCGTVFALTTSGAETVLHSFGGSGDGGHPQADLINVNGTFYGTTSEAGANCSPSSACGTVFAMSASGAETVLHSFGPSGDGTYPLAGLIDVKGTLYGTTNFGGANAAGTVFALSP